MAATEGRVQFHARVAVKRWPSSSASWPWARPRPRPIAAGLAELGFADDAELAAAIRVGDSTPIAETSAVVADVRAGRVANPR